MSYNLLSTTKPARMSRALLAELFPSRRKRAQRSSTQRHCRHLFFGNHTARTLTTPAHTPLTPLLPVADMAVVADGLRAAVLLDRGQVPSAVALASRLPYTRRGRALRVLQLTLNGLPQVFLVHPGRLLESLHSAVKSGFSSLVIFDLIDGKGAPQDKVHVAGDEGRAKVARRLEAAFRDVLQPALEQAQAESASGKLIEVDWAAFEPGVAMDLLGWLLGYPCVYAVSDEQQVDLGKGVRLQEPLWRCSVTATLRFCFEEDDEDDEDEQEQVETLLVTSFTAPVRLQEESGVQAKAKQWFERLLHAATSAGTGWEDVTMEETVRDDPVVM